MIDCGRFTLRFMHKSDIPEVCRLFKSDSGKMLSERLGSDMDETAISDEFEMKIDEDSSRRLYFLVRLKKSGKLIGYVAITDIDWTKGCGEISVMVDEQYQSIGYGPMAMTAIVDYCFSELNFVKVYTKVLANNFYIPDKSFRQLIRGFDSDGYTMADYYYKEIRRDMI